MEEQEKNDREKAEAPILVLTEAAKEKVISMMAKEGQEGYGLRIAVVTGGCAGLSYDLRFQKNSYANDTVIEQEAFNIFVNPESLPHLKGVVIDYVDTLKESGFKYKNPNSSGSCSCGTSFT